MCDTSGTADEAKRLSPVQCFQRAADINPEFVVVRFGDMPTGERNALVELCAALKHSHHTRNSHLLALLHSMHRMLLEDLNQAGVDYVHIVGTARLDSNQIRSIVKALGPADRLKRYLKTVCPFLHYSRIDSRREIKLCGAYLDRLVLGGCRLHELCETADHLQCEYYIKPRCTA